MTNQLRIIAHGCQVTLGDQVFDEPSSSIQPNLRSAEPGVFILTAPNVPRRSTYSIAIESQAGSRHVYNLEIPLSTYRSFRHRQWRALQVIRLSSPNEKDDGWRVRAFDVIHNEARSIIILSVPDTKEWMDHLPDDAPLGDLTIPGTHESCALYGYPISQCQQPSTSIAQQLLDGVRFFDVRLRVVGDELLMYHGPRPQRSSLPILLNFLHAFLDSHPSETFFLCLKEESPPFHPNFASMVYTAFKPYRDKWFLENRIPRLGEVRGKGILMTRFEDPLGDWKDGLGVHPSTWPDSRKSGFSWDCGGTLMRTQDWYRVSTFLEIPEKFEVIVNSLIPTLDEDASHPFTLSYTSASSFPLSLPTTIAKGFGWPNWGLGVYGINSRLVHWLLIQISQGKRVRACLPMDFYRQCGENQGLAEILVSMNFV